MNRLQKFNLFVIFTFFLGVISPSIRAVAATNEERLQHGGQALLNLAAEISGISGVAEHCL
ncbi:MAG: hypothetical protein LBI41_04625 [Lactobacillales bacterium]|jgi:hypothetical protein|nr:hypothetical protein [Lactobacillales bacterium]